MSNIARMMQRATAGAGGATLDVDDVFSTHLYNGNSSNQTITNGLDLSNEGGLVWVKGRSGTSGSSAWGGDIGHTLFDSTSAQRPMNSALTNARTNFGAAGVNFTSTGFTVGWNGYNDLNTSGFPYVSWSFRKAPKFFDAVSFIGDGSSNRSISHNLGSIPGFIIIKDGTNVSHWYCWHNSFSSLSSGSGYIMLNSTNGVVNTTGVIDTVTSTSFNVTAGATNASGAAMVAYVFANNNNDGEFGPDADQDIIKCGVFTDNGSETTVNLGFEPQWLLAKKHTSGAWEMIDNMRGLASVNYRDTPLIYANSSVAENYTYKQAYANNTGFTWKTGQLTSNNDVVLYVAIRARDGNVVAQPEAATDAFDVSVSAGSTGTVISTGFPVDMQIQSKTTGPESAVLSRKQFLNSVSTATSQNGGLNMLGLKTASTASEFYNDGTYGQLYNSTGFSIGSTYNGVSTAYYSFKRARGFFDVVTYTGTGSAHAEPHNLGKIPDLLIVKSRGFANGWWTTSPLLGLNSGVYPNVTKLESTLSSTGGSASYFSQQSTSTNFYPGSTNNVSSQGYIAYLFGTVDGVSKVGTYTGTGSDIDVDCGFSSGARFVLVKRVNEGYSSDWYIWDSVRGIVSGNDPYLLTNSASAQVTNTDYIDPLNSGFTVTSNGSSTVNISGGTYLFYAIA